MRIKFLKPNLITGKIKCTVHLNGKLGFSQAAVKVLDINEKSWLQIGINEEDENDHNLYMVIVENQNGDAFKINKAGDYYYVNTKDLFDILKVDYKNYKIIYDIEEIEYENRKMYKLIRRELKRKK